MNKPNPINDNIKYLELIQASPTDQPLNPRPQTRI